jgi:hypothetical protein
MRKCHKCEWAAQRTSTIEFYDQFIRRVSTKRIRIFNCLYDWESCMGGDFNFNFSTEKKTKFTFDIYNTNSDLYVGQ